MQDKKGNGQLILLSQQTINTRTHGVYFSLRDATPSVVKRANRNLEVTLPQGYDGWINRFMLEQKNGKWVWTDFEVGYDDGRYEYDSSTTYDYDGYNG